MNAREAWRPPVRIARPPQRRSRRVRSREPAGSCPRCRWRRSRQCACERGESLLRGPEEDLSGQRRVGEVVQCHSGDLLEVVLGTSAPSTSCRWGASDSMRRQSPAANRTRGQPAPTRQAPRQGRMASRSRLQSRRPGRSDSALAIRATNPAPVMDTSGGRR